MSYEQFRHSVVARFMDFGLPAEVLNRLMLEIDTVAQDYTIQRACTDLISVEEGVPVMVKNYIAALAVKNCSKTTLQDYTRGLVQFFDAVRKPYTPVTTNDIRLYLFSMGQKMNWCPATADHKRTIINSFFSWCVDEEILNRNPARSIPVIKVPKKKLKPLKQIELEHLRDACETPREKALVDLLFASGIRVSECAALTLDDINWNERSVLVRHGKGDKERITYFNPEAEVSLKNYLAVRVGGDQHLFCKTRAPYTGITKEAIEAEIRKIRERVENLSVTPTPHTFRRTMATTASERGMSVEEVQFLLGHASIQTTMQYVTTSDTRVKNDYARIMSC